MEVPTDNTVEIGTGDGMTAIHMEGSAIRIIIVVMMTTGQGTDHMMTEDTIATTNLRATTHTDYYHPVTPRDLLQIEYIGKGRVIF